MCQKDQEWESFYAHPLGLGHTYFNVSDELIQMHY